MNDFFEKKTNRYLIVRYKFNLLNSRAIIITDASNINDTSNVSLIYRSLRI